MLLKGLTSLNNVISLASFREANLNYFHDTMLFTSLVFCGTQPVGRLCYINTEMTSSECNSHAIDVSMCEMLFRVGVALLARSMLSKGMGNQ